MNALEQAIDRIAEGTPLRDEAAAELAFLRGQVANYSDEVKRLRRLLNIASPFVDADLAVAISVAMKGGER